MADSGKNAQVSRLALLEAARNRLAEEMQECKANELPGIVRELRLVTSDIAALAGDEIQNGGTVDNLAAKRRARREASA